mgnify:CR=1 FL=1|jgi:hypothetical protein
MEEILNFILNLFVEEGIIIAVAAFVVGEIVKPLKVPNKLIPLIGGILGILLGIFLPTVFADKDIVTSAILGLALGWGATGGYETIKQLTKKGE